MTLQSERRTMDLVADHLRDKIVSGDLKANERIDLERLGAELQVSRTPIREAVMRLEAEGFINRLPYRGALVAGIDPHRVEEIYALRIHVEGLAARLGAARISSASIAEMEEVLADLEECAGNDVGMGGFSAANRRFHSLIYEASGSEELVRLINPLAHHAERIRAHYEINRHPRVSAQHRELFEACSRRDPEWAERALRAHLLGVFEVMDASTLDLRFEDLRFLPHTLTSDEAANLEHALAPASWS